MSLGAVTVTSLRSVMSPHSPHPDPPLWPPIVADPRLKRFQAKVGSACGTRSWAVLSLLDFLSSYADGPCEAPCSVLPTSLQIGWHNGSAGL